MPPPFELPKKVMAMKMPNYSFTIRQLMQEEGGGFLIEFPDLPGCMSDGDTLQETIENGNDALSC